MTSLLQSGRIHNADQLADLCEVSRRTIFRDLRALSEGGIPVQYDPARQGYYLPANFFLPPTNFSIDEALSLLVVCYEMGDRDGLPFYVPARTAALKLQSSLNSSNLGTTFKELTRRVHVRLNQRNPLETSEPVYRQLLDSLALRRPVRITYQSLAEGEVIQTRLSPYSVFFSRRSWYVAGRSSLHREVRLFNVGRIRHLEPLDDSYRIPPRFTIERHLGNAWHLIRERPFGCRVSVRFQKMVAQNVAEVRWHKTQKLKWNRDGTLDFHVTVDGLNEISWWILGYGDQAKVLRPRQLRDLVRRRIAQMGATYQADGMTEAGRRRRQPKKAAAPPRSAKKSAKTRRPTKTAKKKPRRRS